MHPDYGVADFIPAYTTTPTPDPRFGGHVVAVYDLRPLEQLQATETVHGLEIVEGSCNPRTLKGSDLYCSKKEAEQSIRPRTR